MQILFTILKAMIIGASGSIPVGPIVVFSLQRSISGGRKSGMACASGAIISDTVYATIAVFAFSAIASFLESNTGVIKLLGGAIIFFVGLSMYKSRVGRVQKRISKSAIALDASKSILMGFSNPGGLLWILAMFAAFRIEPHQMPGYMSLVIILSVCAGSLLYWLAFTKIASKGQSRLSISTLLKVNKISGIFVALFGLYFFLSGLDMTFEIFSFVM